MPCITDIYVDNDPTKLRGIAGKSIVKIIGQNFGTDSSVHDARILFEAAVAAGSPVDYAEIPPSHIVSWKDNEIEVYIPAITIAQGGIHVAGSGPVYIFYNASSVYTSSYDFDPAGLKNNLI